MKKKLLSIFLILICLCSLTVLASCDVILDLIFGPNDPTDNTGNNEPPAHTHKMSPQTYKGETCVGPSEITYYKCSVCNKCYIDEQGVNEIVNETQLEKGHLYVIKITDDEHYSECSLCHTVQDGSSGTHASDRYWYNPTEHYKLCDVCGAKFDNGAHDETGSCSVCGRKADYAAMCNSRYGYNQLASLEHGTDMQKLYNKIDSAVTEVHNKNNSIVKKFIGTDAETNEKIEDYALNKISYLDSSISPTEARATIACYLHDNPLYYWISKQFWVDAASITICVLEDYANGNERAAQNEKIYSEIDRYMSIVAKETDLYNITLALHDEIINSIDYAYTSDGDAESEMWAHSIVGVFDNKSAVCEGYAKAFQLLLNACDVDNVYVTGSSKGVGHAWNLVNLDRNVNNQWYWYDLTWDDQPSNDNGKSYDYFCKTDSVFDRDHDVTVSNINDGVNYLYVLPETAATDYFPSGWKIGEAVTINGITYELIGNNRLAVTKILNDALDKDGVVTIPSTVIRYGKKYPVKQIDSEALVTYYRDKDDKIVGQAGPKITKLIIPGSVDTIYNMSIRDCSTLVSVHFDSPSNWQRYGWTVSNPKYEQISADDLSNDASACRTLKEVYKPSLLSSSYYYVWVKTAN